MVDIETLGTKPGSVILSIGACRFDDTGIGERFYRPIDVFDSLMHGLTVDQATVGWWRLQSAEARGALAPGQPLAATLDEFVSFIGAKNDAERNTLVWAKGPDFDLVLLEAAYALLPGRKKPWSYRTARDVRTILALATPTEPVAAGVIHHALHDAEKQAVDVIDAAKKLGVSLAEMA